MKTQDYILWNTAVIIILLLGGLIWYLVLSIFTSIICLSLGITFLWNYTFALMALQFVLSPPTKNQKDVLKKEINNLKGLI